jgi:hypothetical protein
MFLRLPDLLVFAICTDPDLDPSINKQEWKSKKNFDLNYFWLLFDVLSVKPAVNVPSKSNKQKALEKKIFFVGILSAADEKIGSGAGSESGFISQWYRSPDPYQNVTDPHHCYSLQ